MISILIIMSTALLIPLLSLEFMTVFHFTGMRKDNCILQIKIKDGLDHIKEGL